MSRYVFHYLLIAIFFADSAPGILEKKQKSKKRSRSFFQTLEYRNSQSCNSQSCGLNRGSSSKNTKDIGDASNKSSNASKESSGALYVGDTGEMITRAWSSQSIHHRDELVDGISAENAGSNLVIRTRTSAQRRGLNMEPLRTPKSDPPTKRQPTTSKSRSQDGEPQPQAENDTEHGTIAGSTNVAPDVTKLSSKIPLSATAPATAPATGPAGNGLEPPAETDGDDFRDGGPLIPYFPLSAVQATSYGRKSPFYLDIWGLEYWGMILSLIWVVPIEFLAALIQYFDYSQEFWSFFGFHCVSERPHSVRFGNKFFIKRDSSTTFAPQKKNEASENLVEDVEDEKINESSWRDRWVPTWFLRWREIKVKWHIHMDDDDDELNMTLANDLKRLPTVESIVTPVVIVLGLILGWHREAPEDYPDSQNTSQTNAAFPQATRCTLLWNPVTFFLNMFHKILNPFSNHDFTFGNELWYKIDNWIRNSVIGGDWWWTANPKKQETDGWFQILDELPTVLEGCSTFLLFLSFVFFILLFVLCFFRFLFCNFVICFDRCPIIINRERAWCWTEREWAGRSGGEGRVNNKESLKDDMVFIKIENFLDSFAESIAPRNLSRPCKITYWFLFTISMFLHYEGIFGDWAKIAHWPFKAFYEPGSEVFKAEDVTKLKQYPRYSYVWRREVHKDPVSGKEFVDDTDRDPTFQGAFLNILPPGPPELVKRDNKRRKGFLRRKTSNFQSRKDQKESANEGNSSKSSNRAPTSSYVFETRSPDPIFHRTSYMIRKINKARVRSRAEKLDGKRRKTKALREVVRLEKLAHAERRLHHHHDHGKSSDTKLLKLQNDSAKSDSESDDLDDESQEYDAESQDHEAGSQDHESKSQADVHVEDKNASEECLGNNALCCMELDRAEVSQNSSTSEPQNRSASTSDNTNNEAHNDNTNGDAHDDKTKDDGETDNDSDTPSTVDWFDLKWRDNETIGGCALQTSLAAHLVSFAEGLLVFEQLVYELPRMNFARWIALVFGFITLCRDNIGNVNVYANRFLGLWWIPDGTERYYYQDYLPILTLDKGRKSKQNLLDDLSQIQGAFQIPKDYPCCITDKLPCCPNCFFTIAVPYCCVPVSCCASTSTVSGFFRYCETLTHSYLLKLLTCINVCGAWFGCNLGLRLNEYMVFNISLVCSSFAWTCNFLVGSISSILDFLYKYVVMVYLYIRNAVEGLKQAISSDHAIITPVKGAAGAVGGAAVQKSGISGVKQQNIFGVIRGHMNGGAVPLKGGAVGAMMKGFRKSISWICPRRRVPIYIRILRVFYLVWPTFAAFIFLLHFILFWIFALDPDNNGFFPGGYFVGLSSSYWVSCDPFVHLIVAWGQVSHGYLSPAYYGYENAAHGNETLGGRNLLQARSQVLTKGGSFPTYLVPDPKTKKVEAREGWTVFEESNAKKWLMKSVGIIHDLFYDPFGLLRSAGRTRSVKGFDVIARNPESEYNYPKWVASKYLEWCVTDYIFCDMSEELKERTKSFPIENGITKTESVLGKQSLRETLFQPFAEIVALDGPDDWDGDRVSVLHHDNNDDQMRDEVLKVGYRRLYPIHSARNEAPIVTKFQKNFNEFFSVRPPPDSEFEKVEKKRNEQSDQLGDENRRQHKWKLWKFFHHPFDQRHERELERPTVCLTLENDLYSLMGRALSKAVHAERKEEDISSKSLLKRNDDIDKGKEQLTSQNHGPKFESSDHRHYDSYAAELKHKSIEVTVPNLKTIVKSAELFYEVHPTFQSFRPQVLENDSKTNSDHIWDRSNKIISVALNRKPEDTEFGAKGTNLSGKPEQHTAKTRFRKFFPFFFKRNPEVQIRLPVVEVGSFVGGVDGSPNKSRSSWTDRVVSDEEKERAWSIGVKDPHWYDGIYSNDSDPKLKDSVSDLLRNLISSPDECNQALTEYMEEHFEDIYRAVVAHEMKRFASDYVEYFANGATIGGCFFSGYDPFALPWGPDTRTDYVAEHLTSTRSDNDDVMPKYSRITQDGETKAQPKEIVVSKDMMSYQLKENMKSYQLKDPLKENNATASGNNAVGCDNPIKDSSQGALPGESLSEGKTKTNFRGGKTTSWINEQSGNKANKESTNEQSEKKNDIQEDTNEQSSNDSLNEKNQGKTKESGGRSTKDEIVRQDAADDQKATDEAADDESEELPLNNLPSTRTSSAADWDDTESGDFASPSNASDLPSSGSEGESGARDSKESNDATFHATK